MAKSISGYTPGLLVPSRPQHISLLMTGGHLCVILMTNQG